MSETRISSLWGWIILVVILGCSLSAQAKYGGGKGTAEDPYQIADYNDLYAMADETNDYNKCFIMTADIDLDPNGPGGQVFTTAVIAPDINNVNWDFDGSPFTGVFDGAGRKIVNLTINTNGVGNDNLGLFGCVSGGEIKDLGLENVSIIGGDDSMCLGGLVGENDGDSISNCYSTGVVISGGGGDSVCFGGLAGVNHGTLNNCYSTCAVSGGENSDNFGGLVGGNSGDISNCIATGDVTGDDDGTESLGGLVGGNSGDISNCIATGDVTGRRYSGSLGGLVGNNRGTISNCRSTGAITGGDESDDLGGLVGNTYDGSSIVNCYSTGNVTGGGSARCLGGLVGFNWRFSGTSTISNCYALGAVAGGNDSSALGGLVGENYDGSIGNCYSTGTVIGGGGSYDLGGLVGENYYGTVSNCCFLINSGPDNGFGMPLTDTQMKQQSSFIGWDFINIWDIGENQTYPYLRTYLASDINHDWIVNFFDFCIIANQWMEEE